MTPDEFLNKDGVSKIWQEAKTEAGDGMSKTGSVLSVDSPVRSILTQSEFDALSEEQKNKGLYIISDGDGNNGGNDFDSSIYSTDETRIGTWIDGRPLYRKVFSGILPAIDSSQVQTPLVLTASRLQNILLVHLYGTVTYSDQQYFPINSPDYIAQTYDLGVLMYYRRGSIVVSLLSTDFSQKEYRAVFEYTKLSDPSTIEVQSISETGLNVEEVGV